MISEGHLGTYVQSVSPDGSTAIVTEGVGEDSDKLMLLDIASKKLTTIAAPDPRANHANGDFAWATDSKGFYFASNEGREFSALAFHDIAAQQDDNPPRSQLRYPECRALRPHWKMARLDHRMKTASTSCQFRTWLQRKCWRRLRFPKASTASTAASKARRWRST